MRPCCLYAVWLLRPKKGVVIYEQKHMVLKAPHQSPLSAYRGFFGCKHFSKANSELERQGKAQIEWALPNPPLT